MKRISKILSLIFFSILLLGCEEDEGKIIQTDLSFEANELFGISTILGESLYFGLLSFEDYSLIPSIELPGCPSIQIDSTLKRITLIFDSPVDCPQNGSGKRLGKIILQYPLGLSPKPKWTLSYQDYSFQNTKIQGNREFTLENLNLVKESFVAFKTTSSREGTSLVSGTMNHTLTKLRFKLIGASSSGSFSGTNSAGRSFVSSINSPKQALVACFTQNNILPIAGKETWTIDRGDGKSVSHLLTYETSGSCDVLATVKLSDGRNLIVSI